MKLRMQLTKNLDINLQLIKQIKFYFTDKNVFQKHIITQK